jgi:site-specific recombinase XerD
MGVKLRENIKKSGVKSLYLDITTHGKRYKHYVGLHLVPGKDKASRDRNRETKKIAEGIRAAQELKLQAQDYNYIPGYKRKVDFMAFFERYVMDYRHRDKRLVEASFRWFVKFLEVERVQLLRANDLTNELCRKYQDYLQENLSGETPYNYFAKFRRVVNSAVDKEYLTKNPTKGIKCTRDEGLKKDILTFDEIERLAGAYCGNAEVKRAFLFSLYTGLRWCDIRELKYKNLDLASGKIKVTQEKTKNRSRNSMVIIDLNPTAVKLIGDMGEPDANVFSLPSHNGCLKALKLWTKKAGIDKHITWHCARHSIAVNLLTGGADIKTVASILGHSGLRTVEKYTRAVDELKKKAIDNLPELKNI